MKIPFTALAFLFCTSWVAYAQCDSKFESDLRGATEAIKSLEQAKRRLQSRLDGQDFRISNLSADRDKTGLPDAPALPEIALPAAENGEGCTIEPVRQMNAAAEARTAIDDVSASIATRDRLLTEVEKDGRITSVAVEAPESQEDEKSIDAAPENPAATEAATAPQPPLSQDSHDPGSVTAEASTARGATDAAKLPMTDPQNADAYIRVIAQPGMTLHADVGATDPGTEVPVFSILYVFDRRESGGRAWMNVGRTVRGGPEGWAPADKSVDWTNMLVMQFAPRGKRNQVLFFEEESALNSLVSGPFYQRDAQRLYDSIADERGKPEPQWDKRLVAIEPETAITYDSKPYLLPILDWRSEMFDGTTDTTLVRVAALPSAPSAKIGTRDEESFKNDSRLAAGRSGEFRVGVVFVIDTTISMRPFIERTRQAVEHFYEAFSKYETSNYVSFGLVGFRDNISANPDALEYVTRVFQPLDPEAPGSDVLSNVGRVTEASAPTKGFAEDAIAGLTDAIDQNDWSPYNARVIILVTDASARSGDGVQYPDMTLSRLREKARQQRISIVPLHLLTPANASGDADIARGQYSDLAGTGDIGSDKYISIDATSDEEFSRTVSRLATEVARSTMVVNSGELLLGEEDEPIPGDLAKPEEKIAAVINNEIFRAQLESLGDIDDGAAPAFLSGWAADRDLTAPEAETLEVSAFLTRNQLSTLDKRLEAIIDAFRSGGDNPQTFFANLQKLAAETATDPDNIRSGDSSTIEAILPAFLKNLPYRSQVLRLDQAYWSSMSVAQQQEFIEDLGAKRKIYGDIFGQTNNWADLGAGDPGLEATPIRLVHLP